MQARGLLMIEHRLIERMIAIVKDSLTKIESTQQIDPLFVDKVVDFIRTYADRTHHGKEEDILFRDLSDRAMPAKDKSLMQELVDEHIFGRQTTKSLVEANTRYRNGDVSALSDIIDRLRTLTEFYPRHIEKEDKVFFPAYHSSLTDEEDQKMLSEFYEFDKKMIHEMYMSVVQELETDWKGPRGGF